MARVFVGKIDTYEQDQLIEIYAKKRTLEEVLMAMKQHPEWTTNLTMETLSADIRDLAKTLDAWWQMTAGKHMWTYSRGDRWEVDFSTSSVYITSHNVIEPVGEVVV